MIVKGILLDVDGTLVDSNDAHAKAWVKALKQGGYDVPYEKARSLIGMGSDNFLPNAVGVQKDSPDGKKLTQYWKEIFEEEYLPHLKPFPGSHDLVKKLREVGFKVAVASSAEKQMLDQLLRIAGAEGLIEEKTSSSDAKKSKPDPDIVEAAVSKIGLPAENLVMIGDTPYDVESAGKAGVGTIGLRCGGWDEEGLKGAIAIYNNPADLLAHFDSSPLGQNGSLETTA